MQDNQQNQYELRDVRELLKALEGPRRPLMAMSHPLLIPKRAKVRLRQWRPSTRGCEGSSLRGPCGLANFFESFAV